MALVTKILPLLNASAADLALLAWVFALATTATAIGVLAVLRPATVVRFFADRVRGDSARVLDIAAKIWPYRWLLKGATWSTFSETISTDAGRSSRALTAVRVIGGVSIVVAVGIVFTTLALMIRSPG